MNENLEPTPFANAEGDNFTVAYEENQEIYNLPATYKCSISMPCYISINESMNTYSIVLSKNTSAGTDTPIEQAVFNNFMENGVSSNLSQDNDIDNALTEIGIA